MTRSVGHSLHSQTHTQIQRHKPLTPWYAVRCWNRSKLIDLSCPLPVSLCSEVGASRCCVLHSSLPSHNLQLSNERLHTRLLRNCPAQYFGRGDIWAIQLLHSCLFYRCLHTCHWLVFSISTIDKSVPSTTVKVQGCCEHLRSKQLSERTLKYVFSTKAIPRCLVVKVHCLICEPSCLEASLT